jgi:outer membrane protein OmpA-like peptidoglycan-associated protein
MRLILLFLTLLVVPGYFGQLKAKLADEHFGLMEYARCVRMYDELSAKYLKKQTINTQTVEYIRRAGISHFHLFEMEKSVGSFASLDRLGLLNEKDLEFYFKALRYLKEYEKSHALLTSHPALVVKSKFLSRIANESSMESTFFRDTTRYRIYDSGLNSDKGDFGASYYQKELAYVSKSTNYRNFKSQYGWDLDFYTNVHLAKPLTDSTFEKGALQKAFYQTKAHDGPVSFNSKGDQMLITRNSVEVSKGAKNITLSLYLSTLANGIWTEPVLMSINASGYNSGHAVFGENDQSIYFVSDRPGGFGEADIWKTTLANGNWSLPINLGEKVNTSQNEFFPFVHGQKLYFASDGHFGLGGLDIFETDLALGNSIKNLGAPVNSSYDDFALITLNGITGFISSNRRDNTDRIYYFRKFPIRIELNGIVYARYKENEPLAQQLVTITDMESMRTDSLLSNEFGQFSKLIEANHSYKISTHKDEFILLKEANIATLDIVRDTVLHCELALKPTTIQIHLRVTEERSGKVISQAKTSLTDYSINKDTSSFTNELGMVTFKADRNKTYWAYASKKGYKDDNTAFNTTNENDKVIDLELRLPPIVKGDRFKLENIFYDLNKSTLRPESKIALDKLADFILKNDLKIELSAHTDARGSDSYNLKLSQARAQSCVDYLISKGVKKSNITAKGYGETKLINKCKNNVTCPEELHQENRRTEVKIL